MATNEPLEKVTRVLLPVDGSSSSIHAVNYVIELAKESKSMEIHLLNVQPEINSGEISLYVSVDLINEYRQEQAKLALKPAEKLLDATQVRYTSHIALGRAAETIARYAKEKHCNVIVMGSRGKGSVAGLILGSVSIKVIHLVEVPVTLVK